MNKTLLAAVLLVGLAGTVFGVNRALAANPYDWSWNLNDSGGTPYSYDMQADFGNPDQHIVYIDPSTHLPVGIRLQTGIDVTTDAGGPFLEINGLQISQITGLQTALNTKASTSHTHFANDITNFNSAVDSEVASTTNRQATRVQTDTNGTYTWTFPHAFATSSIPVIEVTPEDPTAAASTDVRVVSVSATSTTVQASRLTTVLGLLSLNSTPQIYVHLMAQKP